ncbi:TRAFAC clade GTPase domain-containing protein [Tessaracoccus flavus]|uniref:Double-GTPase 2 domain-containing protein n=1 Tax=Tessaracoccus flavus TaxID=1610493 RepID=A0A1Q2CH92_9ACTN|nr:hypothetical protein [Tessaracoccus flavus]AQP45443.1 hypothetical protein RPIT_12050 [Tessaracoccus flavus]SDY92077.1 hypothetical protein SAMN05428934_10665 [Tessaracoccus flavus]
MSQCPQCFTPIGATPALYVCKGSCPEIIDTQYTAWFGRERRSRPLTVVTAPDDPKLAKRWRAEEKISCRKCKQSAVRVCPTCHFVLPSGWMDARVVCVALAGPRSTGKSVYIAVMVQKLERLVESLRSKLTPVGSTRHTYDENYHKTLIVARQMMEPTGSATTGNYQQEPLIYSLGRIGRMEQESYLVLRDVAGEDLERNHRESYLQFFRNASMVLFHFDPTQIAEVRNELKGHLTDLNDVGIRPGAVLDNLLDILGAARPRLAVVLSKFDTLQLIGEGGATGDQGSAGSWTKRLANVGAAFNREAPEDMRYDEADGQVLHEEARSLLTMLGAVGIVNQLERPAKGGPMIHRFFVSSALGEPPLNRRTNPRGIAPFRVLDPIKWVLAAEGVIERVGGE